jgi:hypothetical protein
MRIPEFNAFVLVADREKLDIPNEWNRTKTEIIFVSQQEPQISGALEDGKVRLGWRRSETLITKKRDSVLEEVRLKLRRSETLLNNLNITVFNNKNMGAKPAPARAAAPTPQIEPIHETPQTPKPVQTPQTRIEAFPADCQSGAQLMQEIFNVIAPERPTVEAKGGDFALWIKGIRALEKRAADYDLPLETALRLTHEHWNKSPFSVSHPAALQKTMVSALAQNIGRNKASQADEPTVLEQALRDFVPSRRPARGLPTQPTPRGA